jgi:hypothetical protein
LFDFCRERETRCVRHGPSWRSVLQMSCKSACYERCRCNSTAFLLSSPITTNGSYWTKGCFLRLGCRKCSSTFLFGCSGAFSFGFVGLSGPYAFLRAMSYGSYVGSAKTSFLTPTDTRDNSRRSVHVIPSHTSIRFWIFVRMFDPVFENSFECVWRSSSTISRSFLPDRFSG